MTLDVLHPTCVKIIVVQQLLKNRDNEIEAVPRKSSLILIGVPSRALDGMHKNLNQSHSTISTTVS